MHTVEHALPRAHAYDVLKWCLQSDDMPDPLIGQRDHAGAHAGRERVPPVTAVGNRVRLIRVPGAGGRGSGR